MKREQIWEIANAVLYEGYLLYPYRHSALKNRQRWNIGVVYPREYTEARGGTEPCAMRTECLVVATGAQATLDVTVRFLHLLTRSSAQPGADVGPFDSWQEGVERAYTARGLALDMLTTQEHRVDIQEPSAWMEEADERSGATITREQQSLSGAITISATPMEASADPDAPHAPIFKVAVHVENTTLLRRPISESYEVALLRAFVSTHAILEVSGGAFVSLLDPPASLRAEVDGCQHQGAYPVLAGDEGQRDTMLCSPIILYDYPRIASESAGGLFDGTEIDEILSLRILTLSDEEKAELRDGDERARAILERTESLSAEQLMKLHGVIRALGPASAPRAPTAGSEGSAADE